MNNNVSWLDLLVGIYIGAAVVLASLGALGSLEPQCHTDTECAQLGGNGDPE